MSEQNNGVLSVEEARALLQANERDEMQVFIDEYNLIVKRLGWQLTAVPRISNDGRITAVLEIRRVIKEQ